MRIICVCCLAPYFSDCETRIESDPIDALSRMQARFEKPVAYAIFIFGTAPWTDLGTGDSQPEAPPQSATQEPEAHDIRDEAKPIGPACTEISFLGFGMWECPRWVQNTVRRMHCNLGHPPMAAFGRHLAQEFASPKPLMAARALRCSICERTHRPREARPAKMLSARCFDGRVILDIIFAHIITNAVHAFLSLVDDMTTYHTLNRIEKREPTDLWRFLLRRGAALSAPLTSCCATRSPRSPGCVHELPCGHVVQAPTRSSRCPLAGGIRRTTWVGRRMDHGEVD